MAELILRMRGLGRPRDSVRRGDRPWFMPVAAVGALLVAGLITVSPQAAGGLVLVVLVLAIYQHDRQGGIIALLALWFAARLRRRGFLLLTRYDGTGPLCVTPFLATP